MVTVRHIREAVQELGLAAPPVCVHASLRSFGWVTGGAAAVINGLLAEGCTVMVPTFSWTFAVPPRPCFKRARNGWNHDAFEAPTSGSGRVFSPAIAEVDTESMGVIAAALAAMPGRVRGNHPLCSFAAVGPLAAHLTSDQSPLRVWGPLEALAQNSGWVLLMGVGLDKMTLLHLAEQMAGRNPFRRWANGPDGQPMEVEAGGCSQGFRNLESVLSPLRRESTVGSSRWLAFPARQASDAAATAIRDNPQLTHCGDRTCDRCNDAVRGGPILADGRGSS